MKEQGLKIQIVLEPGNRKRLTDEKLKAIRNAVYASIESELEEIRKGKAEEYCSAEIEDYAIYPSIT